MDTSEMTKEEFLLSLLEFHRPIKKKDEFVYGVGQYLVRCQACDGVDNKIWQPGDPEIECEVWRTARSLGLVK